MTDRELEQEWQRLQILPATTADWRDLYETIEAYKQRCLARAIAASPRRDELVAAIRQRAEAH